MNEKLNEQPIFQSEPLDPKYTEVTPTGGKQSIISGQMTEVPPWALIEVSKVMKLGAEKYGHHNWHKISVMSEIDHAMEHTLNFMIIVEDADDTYYEKCLEELSHAAARMLMALDQFIRKPRYLREQD